jgi:hypothetical protein
MTRIKNTLQAMLQWWAPIGVLLACATTVAVHAAANELDAPIGWLQNLAHVSQMVRSQLGSGHTLNRTVHVRAFCAPLDGALAMARGAAAGEPLEPDALRSVGCEILATPQDMPFSDEEPHLFVVGEHWNYIIVRVVRPGTHTNGYAMVRVDA